MNETTHRVLPSPLARTGDAGRRALTACIEACADAMSGYEAAARGVRDPQLRARLHLRSKERGEFAAVLRAAARALGRRIHARGTTTGRFHRRLIDLRHAVEPDTDRPVLEECLRGERAALATYQGALELASAGVLPIALRSMLEGQANAMAYDLKEMRRELAALSE
jgi:uncharacterized protein (TIGR02284 family)